VRSNRPWRGTISARENSGTARGVRVADGVLRYHVMPPTSASAAAAGTVIGTTPGAWVTDGAKGTTTFVHSFSVQVRPGDGTGSLSTVITFSVNQ
jgi:hypothetical protein